MYGNRESLNAFCESCVVCVLFACCLRVVCVLFACCLRLCVCACSAFLEGVHALLLHTC
jgi:hypothetical protein